MKHFFPTGDKQKNFTQILVRMNSDFVSDWVFTVINFITPFRHCRQTPSIHLSFHHHLHSAQLISHKYFSMVFILVCFLHIFSDFVTWFWFRFRLLLFKLFELYQFHRCHIFSSRLYIQHILLYLPSSLTVHSIINILLQALPILWAYNHQACLINLALSFITTTTKMHFLSIELLSPRIPLESFVLLLVFL